MADIQTPNGLETAETLADTDIQEVYQGASGGVRRNKRETLGVLRTFFQKILTGSPQSGDLLTSTGAALPQGSGVKLTDVQSDISDNAADIAGNAADIAGNAADISTNEGNITGNTSDIGINVARLVVLEGTGTAQGVGDGNAPTFTGVKTDNVTLKTKVIEIGDWNMDSTFSVTIAHGIADFTKIRAINVIIRDDANTMYRDLNSFSVLSTKDLSQIQTAYITNIILQRDTDGIFDGPDYDSTSYNRGWITITYEA